MVSQQKKVQHLLLRAGFICTPSDILALSGMTIKQVADKLWSDSDASTSLQSAQYEAMRRPKDMTQDERKAQMQKMLKEGKALNLEWLKNMSNTQGVLREKMTFFWHGHFACRSPLAGFAQSLNNNIRENALGKFNDLLEVVSKSPAMLQYLNNEQNKKLSPNENFAREVMELFTIGRGNYSEEDIKNAARAFTGWRFDLSGKFMFAQRQHDTDDKTFLGNTGNYDGDDILGIILHQPATANFIVRKIYRFFVNDTVDEDICNDLAKSFLADYDISKLMYGIFTSDWFYDEKNIGNRIKSPIELMVNMQRAIPIRPNLPDAPLFVQRVLGQMLFNPPNVAGWKGGKNWIDSSSLMFRLSLPGLVFRQDELNIQAKEDPEEAEHRMMQKQQEEEPPQDSEAQPKPGQNRLMVTADWTKYLDAFKDVKTENLYDAISEYLIQVPQPNFKKETIMKYVKKDTREAYIKSLTIALMSVPEYQMC
jgi:uncharacterized protein (DUF1800 family)